MRLLIAGAVLALAACGGSGDAGTAPHRGGPSAMGLLSGNNQVVTAGRDSLPQAVVGRLVRLDNGTVAFQVLKIGNGLLDLVAPRAYAQGTTLTGSPIPGAVTCAVSVDSVHTLTPYVACVNTNDDGMVTYWFTPGNIAGTARAEIRCTVDGLPAVCAVATAEVVAGPVAAIDTHANGGLELAPDGAGLSHSTAGTEIMANVGMRIAVRDLLPACNDQYGNVVEACEQISWGIYAASTPEADRIPQSTADTIVVARPDGTPQQYNDGELDLLYLFSGTGKTSVPLYLVDGAVSAGW